MNPISLRQAIVILVLSLSASGAYAQGVMVVEGTFCLELEGPQCVVPVVSETISLEILRPEDNGQRHLYYWTSIQVSENRNISHVWTAANRSDPWAERVHVSTAERFQAAFFEILETFRRTLVNVLQRNDSLHHVQGVLLPINQSPRFRTYSRIRAIPGTYSVVVQDLNGSIIPGGEGRSVSVAP